jgi:hypothetical protein
MKRTGPRLVEIVSSWRRVQVSASAAAAGTLEA